ncbi:MAG: hypothetical protein J7M39_14675 [Anaerolineae bacterium]|nr:hypothetical protein [Anaerolineae bacterium]
MKRGYVVWLIIVLVLVTAGVLVGRWLVAEVPPGELNQQPRDAAFREWFWERRTLDLVTQAGLMFAGALGVAAILPGNEDIPPPQADLHSYPKESP